MNARPHRPLRAEPLATRLGDNAQDPDREQGAAVGGAGRGQLGRWTPGGPGRPRAGRDLGAQVEQVQQLCAAVGEAPGGESAARPVQQRSSPGAFRSTVPSALLIVCA
jgi:hypothetical protein